MKDMLRLQAARGAAKRFSTFLQPLCKTLYFAGLRLAEGKAVHL